MASVLILGKYVAPQFLILSHELEHGLSVTLFFLIDVDVRNLLGLESARSDTVLRFFTSGTSE